MGMEGIYLLSIMPSLVLVLCASLPLHWLAGDTKPSMCQDRRKGCGLPKGHGVIVVSQTGSLCCVGRSLADR